MKLASTIRNCLVTGAVLGMLLPQVSLAETRAVRPLVKDAALQHDGTLRGAILSPDGEGQAGRAVQLLSHGEVVARTATDREGRFAFRGLRPGVYGLQADGIATGYRLWSAAAAPPSAVSDILLVSGEQPVVRGKGGSRLGGYVSKPLLLGGLLIAAGVIGGVIGYNIRDTAS